MAANNNNTANATPVVVDTEKVDTEKVDTPVVVDTEKVDTPVVVDTEEVDKEKIFGMALIEMEYKAEMCNEMVNTCFAKCVDNRYREGELYLGEATCVDRCVSKYYQVTNLVGHLLAGNPPM